MIRVKLYGRARELTGKEEVQIELTGQTKLKDLIRGVLKDHDVASSKDIHAILINGRNCIFLDGMDSLIQDGDMIDILPIVTGG